MGHQKKLNKRPTYRTKNLSARKTIEKLIVKREAEVAELEKTITFINEAYTDSGGKTFDSIHANFSNYSLDEKKIENIEAHSDSKQNNLKINFFTQLQWILENKESLDIWYDFSFTISKPPLTKEEYEKMRASFIAASSQKVKQLKKQIKSLRRKIATIYFIRNIRQFYRHIIKFLFKNMDDESGDVAIANSKFAIPHLQNLIHEIETRMYRYNQLCA